MRGVGFENTDAALLLVTYKRAPVVFREERERSDGGNDVIAFIARTLPLIHPLVVKIIHVKHSIP